MQHAPPVTYPLGRSRVATVLTAIGWGAGLLGVLLWLAQPGLAPWRQCLSVGLALVCGLNALRSYMNVPTGQLAWTGQHWLWSFPGGELEGTVRVCLDLQTWLLLRMRTLDGRVLWMWLERGERPERWAELRRAVHARSRPIRAATDGAATQTQ